MMTYSDYRRIARENLAGNWPLSIGVAAIALLLGGAIVGASFIPQLKFQFRGQNVTLEEWADLITTIGSTIGSGAVSLSLLGLAEFIIGGVIQLGYAQYLLKQYNRANFELNDLFSQFDRFGQGFLLNFLRGLYVFLWSLLLIVPGIIKSYAYSMAPFIMAENPDMTANEAITASKELMEGNKFELFLLDLTFIGWDFLAALSLNLGHLALNPYKNAARAVFYKDLTTPPAPNPCFFNN